MKEDALEDCGFDVYMHAPKGRIVINVAIG